VYTCLNPRLPAYTHVNWSESGPDTCILANTRVYPPTSVHTGLSCVYLPTSPLLYTGLHPCIQRPTPVVYQPTYSRVVRPTPVYTVLLCRPAYIRVYRPVYQPTSGYTGLHPSYWHQCIPDFHPISRDRVLNKCISVTMSNDRIPTSHGNRQIAITISSDGFPNRRTSE
jgi:hypothetical protein